MSRRRPRISQPDSGPLPDPGSNLDPSTHVRGSSAGPLPAAPGTNDLTPRHRMRVRGLDEDDAITIAPAQIEVCSDQQWQRAIDLLADLLAPAFRQRLDDSKAA
jgi:hypothetical protein